MSINEKIPFTLASFLAQKIIDRLSPYCARIEVAGSIRRNVHMVGDIEIICIPRKKGIITNFFGDQDTITDPGFTKELLSLGSPEKFGNKYAKIQLGSEFKQGLNLDIFMTTEYQWGIMFLIRTGPAEFSKKIVTHARKGGYLPGWAKVKDGFLWDWSRKRKLATYEEEDVFKILGIPWIPPEERDLIK